ncbi:MAG: hypothetical protein AB7M05_19550 [Alphaproteobacteria bacterium]
MAYVNIEEIIDHLSTDIRRALEDTIQRTAPNTQIDRYQLFREFKRAVRRKCGQWEQVPDSLVRK